MTGRSKQIWVAAFAALNLILLIRTLAGWVGFVDSGELAVVCSTLGIAHPTGYPLYTLLGRILTLVYPGEVIEAVSFVSLAASLVSALLLLHALHLMFSRIDVFGGKTGFALPAASFSTLLLLYNPIVWSLSVTNEVYALNLFFLAAVMFAIERFNSKRTTGATRTVAMIAYLLGLSFCNHSSTMFLAIGVLFWAFATVRVRSSLKSSLPISLLLFATALTLFIYLPIRASQSPLFNWGDPSTIENFIRHASGWQYRTWMFNKPLAEHLTSILALVWMVLKQFPLILALPAIAGFTHLWRKDKAISGLLIVVFGLNIVFAAGYTIPEIDTYMLPSLFVYVFWVAVGTAYICMLLVNLTNVKRASMLSSTIAAAIFLAAGISMIISNWSRCDRSDYYYVDRQTDILLDGFEHNAIFLTANWSFYSPLMYKQYVDGERQDVTAVDIELLRRSWYFDYLQQADPALAERISAEKEAFLPLVRRFERGLSYDVAKIENAYQAVIRALATVPDRPVYIDHGSSFKDVNRFVKVPGGLAYRLLRADESFQPKQPVELTLGPIPDGLLEFDYMLEQQLRILDLMNRESKSYWEWYRIQENSNANP